MNKTKIRLAGAQIPCSKNIQKNIETIKTAIDWAVENKVDYLVTPEASLSGYQDVFDSDDLKNGLTEVESYVKETGISLCLGTLWNEPEEGESVRRNQIRSYDYNGMLQGIVNKTILCPLDEQLGVVRNPFFIPMFLNTKVEKHIIPTAGYICNDLYGKYGDISLTDYYSMYNFKLYIHSTNAERNVNPIHDKIFNDWNTANIQISSYLMPKRVLLTVDNCIGMNGEDYNGPTSSPSGILKGGEWLVQAPRTGQHFFYYDFDFDDLAVHEDKINEFENAGH